jgi:hypothetical protein
MHPVELLLFSSRYLALTAKVITFCDSIWGSQLHAQRINLERSSTLNSSYSDYYSMQLNGQG